jgi:hypothetical protein
MRGREPLGKAIQIVREEVCGLGSLGSGNPDVLALVRYDSPTLASWNQNLRHLLTPKDWMVP